MAVDSGGERLKIAREKYTSNNIKCIQAAAESDETSPAANNRAIKQFTGFLT